MDKELIENNKARPDAESEEPARRKLQIVQAGESRFGIFTEEIAAVVPWQNPAPLPHAPKSVLGVVSVQGRMLTTLSLSGLAAGKSMASDASITKPSHLIALRGDEQLAIAVDSLGEEIEVGARDAQLQPKAESQLVQQVLQVDGTEINILEVKQLFPAAIQGRERRKRRF